MEKKEQCALTSALSNRRSSLRFSSARASASFLRCSFRCEAPVTNSLSGEHRQIHKSANVRCGAYSTVNASTATPSPIWDHECVRWVTVAHGFAGFRKPIAL